MGLLSDWESTTGYIFNPLCGVFYLPCYRPPDTCTMYLLSFDQLSSIYHWDILILQQIAYTCHRIFADTTSVTAQPWLGIESQTSLPLSYVSSYVWFSFSWNKYDMIIENKWHKKPLPGFSYSIFRAHHDNKFPEIYTQNFLLYCLFIHLFILS